MNVLFVLCTILVVTYSSPVGKTRHYDPNEENMYRTKSLIYQDKDGNYRYEYLLQEIPTTSRASASDVTFYLYTRNNPNTPNVISGNGVNSLASSNYQPGRPNVFLIHGWNNNYLSDVNVIIRSAILNRYDVNVFVVDWSGIANGSYLTAFSQVQSLGEVIGDFINSMMTTYRLSSSKFHLIGYSLGAHISGCIGARVNSLRNSLVNSIIGLDPAGPLFSIGNINNRVDPTDGDFVHIIHTNGGRLGFASAIGDADYYPNGGSSQPGCGLDLIGSCAHARAYIYFAESILSSGFISHKCANYSNYGNGNCFNNHRSFMGEINIDKSASGDYYLNTNSNAPFALR